ncbi:hypothetical protein GW17_00005634 [Ensete ventricosum]|nr:hypothetical protein GW17_00005634 [Ensete ventricosum]
MPRATWASSFGQKPPPPLSPTKKACHGRKSTNLWLCYPRIGATSCSLRKRGSTSQVRVNATIVRDKPSPYLVAVREEYNTFTHSSSSTSAANRRTDIVLDLTVLCKCQN